MEITRISTTSRRRGFTLIELSVVILVLALVVSIVVPNVMAMIAGRRSKNFLSDVRTFSVRARNQAIDTGQTMVLAANGSEHGLTISADTTTTTTNSTNANATANAVTSTDPIANLALPNGTTLQTFKIGTQDSNEGEWKIHFYPDGRSDGGGFEIVQGGLTYSWIVAQDGSNKLLSGSYPDQTSEVWPAGGYEKRL